MTPLELNLEVQEMPPEGKCYECKEDIKVKMFQYFLFETGYDIGFGVNTFNITPTKYKYCEKCYGANTDNK